MSNISEDIRLEIKKLGFDYPQNFSSPFWMPAAPSKHGNFDLGFPAFFIFSLSILTTPTSKYDSLLPPLDLTVAELIYFSQANRKLLLSDLNLQTFIKNHL